MLTHRVSMMYLKERKKSDGTQKLYFLLSEKEDHYLLAVRSVEDETRNARRNTKRNGQRSCFFSNELFEKRPVRTIQDFF